MALTRRDSVVGLLRRHGIRPDKKLGQNFLIDGHALERVIETAELEPQDTVLEVGAGLGTLTLQLAGRARRVVAVEFDRRLAPVLHETTAGSSNIELRFGDILAMDLTAAVGDGPFKVVSNIPYQITSHLIRILLEAEHRPGRIVLTVQREVADRILARSGKMSLLSLGVQAYGKARVTAQIPPEAFYPQPRVTSSVLRIDLYDPPRFTPAGARSIFRLARAGFSQPRKKLRNSLSAGMHESPATAESWLSEAGLSPSARAENVDLEGWVRLADVWGRAAPARG
jgi:16S rRNA (adenine1518-N6/adenine1519-N6)-dimethyltransferase